MPEEQPPAILYKYLPPERVDVLERRLIRFTPPSLFNDIFEFAIGVAKPLGVRFEERLIGQLDETLTSDFLISEATSRGIIPPIANPDWVRSHIEPFMPAIKRYCGTVLKANSPHMLALLNAMLSEPLFLKAADQRGIGVLCLTEDEHNPVMWSHYARNYTGFVLAFDALHPWFWYDDSRQRSRALKVRYDEAVLPEMADLIGTEIVPFTRKRPAWAYEREWRMFDLLESATLREGDSSLFEVPAEAILGVLMGHRIPDEASGRIIRHKVMHLPNTQLRLLRPDYSKGLLESIAIGED